MAKIEYVVVPFVDDCELQVQLNRLAKERCRIYRLFRNAPGKETQRETTTIIATKLVRDEQHKA